MTINPLQDALQQLLADARAMEASDLDDSAAIARLDIAAKKIRQRYLPDSE